MIGSMPTSRRSSRRPYSAGHVPLDQSRARGGMSLEIADDGEWGVRHVVGDKAYRCPGCNQTIAPGSNHVVTWQRDSWQGEAAGVESRRQWHSTCWRRR